MSFVFWFLLHPLQKYNFGFFIVEIDDMEEIKKVIDEDFNAKDVVVVEIEIEVFVVFEKVDVAGYYCDEEMLLLMAIWGPTSLMFATSRKQIVPLKKEETKLLLLLKFDSHFSLKNLINNKL